MDDPTRASTPPLPPELEGQLHAYFAAFLSPVAATEAVDEVKDDIAFWGDHGRVDVFRAAHVVLSARARVTSEVEALVLVEDAELTVTESASILGTDEGRLRSVLAEAFVLAESALRGDPDGAAIDTDEPRDAAVPEAEAPPTSTPDADAPSEPVTEPTSAVEIPPDAEVAPEPVEDVEATRPAPAAPSSSKPDKAKPARAPKAKKPAATPMPASALRPASDRARATTTGSPQVMRVAVGVLFLAVVALTLLLLLKPSGGSQITNADDASIEITDVRLTDVVDTTGNPGPEKTDFTNSETVRLWFTYERRTGDNVELSAIWYRGDEPPLYSVKFTLPQDDRTILTMSRLFMETPGPYRVEIREGDITLMTQSFTVRAAP